MLGNPKSSGRLIFMYLEYRGIFSRIRHHYFRKILRELKAQGCKRLLDYGCGPGDVIQLSLAEGIEATGIDNFPRSVELAAKRGLKVLLGDETNSELAALEFDAIVLQSVLEHVHDPVGLLQRLGKRLRPGGILVVSAPTPCADFWNDPTHVRPFTPASFATMGELLGFETMKNTYVFSYLLGLNLRSAIWYKMINIAPVALGSNLIAFYRKPLLQPTTAGA